MDSKINIEEWIKEKIESITDFQIWYENQVKENPDNFPAEMQAGDWDEQYEFFQ